MGTDLTAVDTPEEAGLDWAVNRKLDFVGRPALDWRPVTRRLRTITLDDATRVVLGGETVWAGGRPVGSVTSAAYGYSVGRAVAYAWLPPESAIGTELEVSWFRERLGARVSEDVSWDPEGLRVRTPGVPAVGDDG